LNRHLRQLMFDFILRTVGDRAQTGETRASR
jgi:hypothetical protein